MAQNRTNRLRPVHGKYNRQYKARPSAHRAKVIKEDLARTQMMQTMMVQLHEEEDIQDLTAALAVEKEAQEEDEKTLVLMIDELTDEAVENTKNRGFNLQEELIPRYVVELDDDEEDAESWKTFHIEMLIPIVLAVLALFGGLYAYFNRESETADGKKANEHDITLIEETTEPEEDPLEIRMKELSRNITEIISDSEGVWSVYVKDLGSDRSFVINDAQMPSASLIKLFTAGKYLEMVENGELYETDWSAYDLMLMISWSDNDAWVELESMIGYGNYDSGLMSVTEFAQRHGYVQSGRDIGAETIYDYNAENLTTAAEIGRVLEEIYKGTYVSAEASARLYSLLSEQGITYKIPSGLPEGFEFASKSGELPGIENDAAIIKGPDTDYILVVMSNEIYDSEYAAERIIQISNLCALTLNPSVK